MTFVVLMTASISLPAFAAPGESGTNALAAPTADPQSLAVGHVNATELLRDGYTVELGPTTASYAQTASTYTNYPGAIQWPFLVGVPISTDYGPRVAPCSGCSTFHKGIDMNPGIGSPIQAVADGVVREVSPTDNGGLGVYVVIDHTIDGQLVSSVYAHMLEGSAAVEVGQPVKVGQLVGNVGNTGQSTGPHLHFEILLDGTTPTDPFAWLTERVRAS